MELDELIEKIEDLDYAQNVEKHESGNLIIIDIESVNHIGRPLTRPALQAGYAIVEANKNTVFLRPFEMVEDTITVETRKFRDNLKYEGI